MVRLAGWHGSEPQEVHKVADLRRPFQRNRNLGELRRTLRWSGQLVMIVRPPRDETVWNPRADGAASPFQGFAGD